MKNKLPEIWKKPCISLALSLLAICGLTACSDTNAAVSNSADTEQNTDTETEVQTETLTEDAEAALDLEHLLLRLRTLYRTDFTFAMNIPDKYAVSGNIVEIGDYSEDSSEEYLSDHEAVSDAERESTEAEASGSDTEPYTSAETSRRLLPPSIPKPETALFTFHDSSPSSETSNRNKTDEDSEIAATDTSGDYGDAADSDSSETSDQIMETTSEAHSETDVDSENLRDDLGDLNTDETGPEDEANLENGSDFTDQADKADPSEAAPETTTETENADEENKAGTEDSAEIGSNLETGTGKMSSGAEPDTDIDTDTKDDANSDIDTDTKDDANSDMDTGTKDDANSDMDNDTEDDVNSDMDTGMEDDVNSDMNTHTEDDVNSDMDTHTEIDTDAENDPEAESDTGSSSQDTDSASTTSEWVLRTIRDYRELRELPLPQLPPTIDRLEAALTRMLADYSGVWSVYIKNLTTGDEILINDSALKSASVMKLFIMGTVYEAIESDELERTQEVVDLLHNMIIYSSNSDANQLLYLLGNGSYIDGIEQVNRYISEQGYSTLTHEYNGFDDPSAYGDPSHFNQISAKDCGELLERIYRRTFASRKVCNEIEEMMLSQNTRYKIPSGIPEEAQVGNKTGEMDTVENDVSIVYGEKSDYILCILSNDWDSKDAAISHISELSSTIYRFFDNEAYYRSSSNY